MKNLLNSTKILLLLILASFFYLEIEAQAKQKQAKLDVEVIGKGNPIIFIPGLISSKEVWRESARELSKDYECHIITLPGFGTNQALDEGPYLTTWAEMIQNYIKKEKLQEVTLVGHSMGGYISLMLGIENVKQLDKIVVIDALPYMPALTNPDTVIEMGTAQAETYMRSFESMNEEQEYMMRKSSAPYFTSDSSKWELLARMSTDSDLKTEAYSLIEMMSTDLRKKLTKIEVPVMVMGAFYANPMMPEMDFKTAKNNYQLQYSEVKNLDFHMSDQTHHFIMWDKPEWMYSNIRKFLSSQMKP